MPKPSVETPPITAERRAVVKDRVELPRVYMAWITPPFFKPGDADADIAATVLGGGKSSRLYKSLVYDKQIAQTVSAQQYSLMLGSVFTIEATARPGHTAEEIEKAIDEELGKLRDARPDAAEVERARNVIETRIVQGLENARRLRRRRRSPEHLQPLPRPIPATCRRTFSAYRDVTPATVKAFAQEQLTPTARVVVYGVPGAAGSRRAGGDAAEADSAAGTGAESINADEAWRKDPPKAGRGPRAAACRCRRRSSCRTA